MMSPDTSEPIKVIIADDHVLYRAGVKTALSAKTANLQAAEFSTNSGKRFLDAGDLDAAIVQFRAAIQASEPYAPAHRRLAQALQRQGHSEEAAKELRRAAELESVSK